MSEPRIHPTARIASTAVIEGDVRIGAHSRVLHGAILSAGDGVIELDAFSIVMEQAVLRASKRFPLTIGDHCLIGPHTSLSGAAIADRVFVATGASVFPGAKIGRGSEVRVNAVVHLRTVLAEGSTVPIAWVAVGDPAQLFPPAEHDNIWAVQRELDFPGFVFGIDREDPDAMVRLTERYADALLTDSRSTRREWGGRPPT
jgi:carbonic anhydrase/acetyltransferase-like protein (isoleucine patch superfamily)